MNVLFVDHYDSFSHLLCDAIKVSIPKANINILRCHDPRILKTKYEVLVLSAGPMHAGVSGYSPKLLDKNDRPVLGVCLGMQIINEYLGGSTERSKVPVHGYPVSIEFLNDSIFRAMPRPFQATRYNSLRANCNSETTSIIAWQKDASSEVMGITDKNGRHLGLQFHPESFQTPHGNFILKKAFEFLLAQKSR